MKSEQSEWKWRWVNMIGDHCLLGGHEAFRFSANSTPGPRFLPNGANRKGHWAVPKREQTPTAQAIRKTRFKHSSMSCIVAEESCPMVRWILAR